MVVFFTYILKSMFLEVPSHLGGSADKKNMTRMTSGMGNPFSFSRSKLLARSLNSVAGFAPCGNLKSIIFWNSANRPAAPGMSKHSVNACQVSLAVGFNIIDIEDGMCMLICPLALISDCTHSFQSSVIFDESHRPCTGSLIVLPSWSFSPGMV